MFHCSDNGLMGGLVGGNAFNDTFDTPSPKIIGLIVAIYEGVLHLWSPLPCDLPLMLYHKSDVFLVLPSPHSSAKVLAEKIVSRSELSS